MRQLLEVTNLAKHVDAELIHSVEIPSPRATNVRLLWAHGWGQSGSAFRPLAEALAPLAPSTLIDFPGFGASAVPPTHWGTAEYADAVQQWMLLRFTGQSVIWIGHSFGCRVGIQLAARHPQALRAMALIAGAGLQRRRSLAQRIRLAARRSFFKAARGILREGPALDRLRRRMGSADYRNAGAMRPILTRVVAEDLSAVASTISCPTLLLYGRNDTETPPEIGERLHTLITGSQLTILEGYGHLDILNEGRHQVALRLRRFLEPYLSQ